MESLRVERVTPRYDASLAFCRGMIGRVSRTFALGINVLPGELGRAVLVSYLICRIADTIEDDATTSPERRNALLEELMRCFDGPDETAAFTLACADIAGADYYLELVRGTPEVFTVFRSFPAASREAIRRWVGEMCRGMAEFVTRYPSGIRIQTTPEFRHYCYYVAGTVGHLLTELWPIFSPTVRKRDHGRMEATCELFGEALQTVNILKDIAWDYEHENAVYVPEELLRTRGSSHERLLDGAQIGENRAAIGSLLVLARSDLEAALEYYAAIPKQAIAIRMFCLLPILFATATLRELERSNAMLSAGGSVKITRKEVRSLIAAGSLTTVSNHATRWLFAKTSRAPFALVLA